MTSMHRDPFAQLFDSYEGRQTGCYDFRASAAWNVDDRRHANYTLPPIQCLEVDRVGTMNGHH
jgi:hypothetical protein